MMLSKYKEILFALCEIFFLDKAVLGQTFYTVRILCSIMFVALPLIKTLATQVVTYRG